MCANGAGEGMQSTIGEHHQTAEYELLKSDRRGFIFFHPLVAYVCLDSTANNSIEMNQRHFSIHHYRLANPCPSTPGSVRMQTDIYNVTPLTHAFMGAGSHIGREHNVPQTQTQHETFLRPKGKTEPGVRGLDSYTEPAAYTKVYRYRILI